MAAEDRRLCISGVSAFPHDKLIAKGNEFWAFRYPAPSQFAVVTQIVDYVCWIAENTVTVKIGENCLEGIKRNKTA